MQGNASHLHGYGVKCARLGLGPNLGDCVPVMGEERKVLVEDFKSRETFFNRHALKTEKRARKFQPCIFLKTTLSLFWMCQSDLKCLGIFVVQRSVELYRLGWSTPTSATLTLASHAGRPLCACRGFATPPVFRCARPSFGCSCKAHDTRNACKDQTYCDEASQTVCQLLSV